MFVERLGLACPVIQAPMAGSQGHALAAAVANAAGLGSLPAALLGPDALRDELRALTAATSAPFAVNFFCHTPPRPDEAREHAWRARLRPYYDELGIDAASVPAGAGRLPFSHDIADVVAPFRPPVVSFHFGLPAPDLLARVRAWGALVVATATTVDEAVWLDAHGVDAIVAQGLEAGGHRGMFLTSDLTTQMGTLALVPQVAARTQRPVIAAGGIADARGVRAALALGASAVQVGTAFLCCPEATTSQVHRAALAGPDAAHTAITNLFSGRPARGLVNRLMRECGPVDDRVPEFPLATAALAPLRAAAERLGRGDFSPLWAGQAASANRGIPATAVLDELAAGV